MLEDKLDLDCITVAKGISQYLTITVPEPPKEWNKIARTIAISSAISSFIEKIHSGLLYAFNKEAYRLKKESIERDTRMVESLYQAVKKDHEEHDKYLVHNGLTTREEKDSWEIVFAASQMLRHNITHRSNMSGELITSKEQFKRTWLYGALGNGMNRIKSKYWIPIKGVEMPEIINPDFRKKAISWIYDQSMERLNEDLKFALLDGVYVEKNLDGLLSLTKTKISPNKKYQQDKEDALHWPLIENP